MTDYVFGSVVDREFRHTLQRMADDVSMQGKTMQELVADGQLTPAQYAEMMTVLNGLIKKGDVGIADININKGKITQNMLAEEVIEAIAGTAAVNAVPADGSITKNKMAKRSIGFDELNIAERNSKNLFSGSYYLGWLAQWTSGMPSGTDKITLTMRANEPGWDGRTAVIKVKPNTTYSVRVIDERDTFRVAVLNREKWNFEQTSSSSENATDQTFVEGVGSEVADGRVRLTTGANARYLLITVSKSGQEPRLMVEEGSAYSPYESGSKIPIDFLESEGGMHNLRFSQGRVVTNGVVQYGEGYSSLILDKPLRLSKGFVIGLHDYSDFSINIVRWDVETGEYLSSYGRRTGHTLTEEHADFQIVLQRIDGTFDYTDEDLEAAKELVFVEYAGTPQKTLTSSPHFLTDDIEHDFEAFEVKDYGGEQDEARNVLHTEVYNDIDVVVSQNDQYISRENQGTSVSGNTIYSYHLRPHTLETRSGVSAPDHPKVIIIAGVHGNEKSTSFAVATLIKLLANHWRENKLLEFLRFNIEFAIIPVANPDGFDSYSRRNANDVDINRDFPELWERITEGSSKNGTEPLSQPESVIISNFIQSHNDAVLGIDYHNMSFQAAEENCTFATSAHSELAQMMNKVQMTAHRHWMKKYNFFPQDDTKGLGYVSPGAVGTVSRHITAAGVPGTTLEVNRTNEWQNKETFGQFDTVVNEMSIELLIETIKGAIKRII